MSKSGLLERGIFSGDVFAIVVSCSGLDGIPTNKQEIHDAFVAAKTACPFIDFVFGDSTGPWHGNSRHLDSVGESLFTLSLSHLIDLAPFTGMTRYVVATERLRQYVENHFRSRFTDEEWESLERAGEIFAEHCGASKKGDEE